MHWVPHDTHTHTAGLTLAETGHIQRHNERQTIAGNVVEFTSRIELRPCSLTAQARCYVEDSGGMLVSESRICVVRQFGMRDVCRCMYVRDYKIEM